MPRVKRQASSTFIEEARRKQMIEAAIQAIASQGYNNTSLASIASQVDVSKGLIAYHFENKNDLITATINAILEDQRNYIYPRVEKQNTAQEKIRTYIQASFEYIKLFPIKAKAIVDLWGSFISPEEKNNFSMNAYNPSRQLLSGILTEGQKTGEFRPLDSLVYAAIIQAVIDGTMMQVSFREGSVDLDVCALEVSEMINQSIHLK